MKRTAAIILACLLVVCGTAVVMAKGKIDIFDLVFEKEEEQQGQTQTTASQMVDIKLVGGETFRMPTNETDFSDVEFTGTMVVQRQDGIYYINAEQVEYIRVANQ